MMIKVMNGVSAVICVKKIKIQSCTKLLTILSLLGKCVLLNSVNICTHFSESLAD